MPFYNNIYTLTKVDPPNLKRSTFQHKCTLDRIISAWILEDNFRS